MCAPVLSGLAAAVQLPGAPAGHLPGIARVPSPALPPLFLHSIRPALDCAFGIEDEADLPDALAALVARLRADAPVPATAD